MLCAASCVHSWVITGVFECAHTLARVPIVFGSTGDWRQPYGSDVIFFHGSGDGVSTGLMPQLVLDVTGPGTRLPVPVPAPPGSVSPGTVLERGSNSVTFTCDGGQPHFLGGATLAAAFCLFVCFIAS